MAVGCCGSCSKMMLIIFNVIFWLSGAALIGIGIWLIVDPNAVKEIDDIVKLTDSALIQYSAYLLLGVGAFVFIVAFIGCCGAIKENRCLLTVYIILLFLVLACELAGGILAYIYRDSIEKKMEEEVTKQVLKPNSYPADPFWRALDYAQSEFKCCGLNNASDYLLAQFKESQGVDTDYPYSCCKLIGDNKPGDNITMAMVDCGVGNIHKQGCKEKLIDMVESKLLVLIGIGIGLAAFQVFMFTFAICLCRSTGDKNYA